MKTTKIITPVLLFLMAILFIIVLYTTFVLKPLNAKVEGIEIQHHNIKRQLVEIETAMLDEKALRDDINEKKALLKEMSQFKPVTGDFIADDIYAKVKVYGIDIEQINITDPSLTDKSDIKSEAMLYVDASLSFAADYDKALRFMESLEKSEIGAYSIESVAARQAGEGMLHWSIVARLYYYGDKSSASSNSEESAEENVKGILQLPGDLL